MVKEYKLTPKPLTKAAFAAFGDVIEVAEKPMIINGGNTERFDSLAKVELEVGEGSDKYAVDTYAVINIFRAQPQLVSKEQAMDIVRMERHPLGSQSFHPLSGEKYLVLVADAVDKISVENLHLFIARSDQGINYHKNTWHHSLLALNKVCDFLVVDSKAAGNNCEEFFFDANVKIRISC